MKRKTPLKRGTPPRRKKPFIVQQRVPLRQICAELSERCCGKRTWATREAAEIALNRIMLTSAEERHPQRVYECRVGNWHLTSKPDRFAPGAVEPVPGAAKPVTPARQATPATVRRWRYTGPTTSVRATVLRRDDFRCTWCGLPFNIGQEYSLQHRRARGAGGSRREDTNSPANLLTVHGSGVSQCHGYIEAHPREAEARGFRIRQNEEPAAVPVMIASLGGGASLFLTHDGGYSTAPPAPEVSGA